MGQTGWGQKRDRGNRERGCWGTAVHECWSAATTAAGAFEECTATAEGKAGKHGSARVGVQGQSALVQRVRCAAMRKDPGYRVQQWACGWGGSLGGFGRHDSAGSMAGDQTYIRARSAGLSPGCPGEATDGESMGMGMGCRTWHGRGALPLRQPVVCSGVSMSGTRSDGP